MSYVTVIDYNNMDFRMALCPRNSKQTERMDAQDKRNTLCIWIVYCSNQCQRTEQNYIYE